MKASHFKIIALRPTQPKDVDVIDFDKVQSIHKGLIGISDWQYIFQGYTVSEDYKSIFLDSFIQKKDYSLYDTADLKISVGAIVGRNGAGKSSLVELLVRVINNISAALLGERFNFAKAEHLHYIDNIYADLLVQIENRFLIISVKGRSLQMLWYKQSVDTIYRFDCYRNDEILNAGDKNNISDKILRGHQKGRWILKRLFYTVVFNYSLYGFNFRDFSNEATPAERLKELKITAKDNPEDEQTSWLGGIFHKNDGYQTPVVLHPMRQDGQLNIIKENKLAKERLMSLLFYKDSDGKYPLRVINEKLEAAKIRITPAARRFSRENMLDTLGIKKTQNVSIYFDGIYDAIFCFWNSAFDISKAHNSPYYSDACDYIVYKTLKIVHSYKKYNSIFRFLSKREFNRDVLSEMLSQLLDDYTHITRKLRQTINFLINPAFNPEETEIEIDKFDNLPNPNLERKYRLFLSDDSVNYLPPPIFETDLILTKLLFDNHEDGFPYMEIPFSGLSSGERQIAYTISNILYHLTNIDSEWDDRYRGKGKLAIIKYKYVSVILDEIELYFHPEMQRQFVFLLLNAIRCVKFRHLKGINLLFVTHSPFILSDIPSGNVLALGGIGENGNSIKTFGANIMEMLADTFFMNSSIGESVRREISRLVGYHVAIVRNDNATMNKLSEYDKDKVRLKYVCDNLTDAFWQKICTRMYCEIENRVNDILNK